MHEDPAATGDQPGAERALADMRDHLRRAAAACEAAASAEGDRGRRAEIGSLHAAIGDVERELGAFLEHG